MPSVRPVAVSAVLSRSLAIPKSVSLTLPVVRDHQVRRLQVAMDHPALVRVLERLANLDPRSTTSRQGRAPRSCEDRVQGRALDEFHRDVQRAPELAIAQVPDDAGMAELVEDLELALEPLLDLVALGELAMDDLDGDDAPALLVGPPIDHAHGAGAQDRLDPVRAELLADQRWSLAHDPGYRVMIPPESRPAAAGSRINRPDRIAAITIGASRTTGRRPRAGSRAGRSPSPCGPR